MLLIYSHTVTSRLQYIADFIGKELFDEPMLITTDKQRFINTSAPRLNYSDNDFSEDEFFIKATPLLFENDIKQQPTECFELNYQKAFFQTRGDHPFDILAASFYLISRYEEYLPHQPDEYGRYAHTNSLAYKEGFLRLPLVNIWLQDFKKALLYKFPSLVFKRKQFKFIPSYDIDIAYSYRQKGLWRNAGGFARDIIDRKWPLVKERWKVLRGKQKDPFDSYEWLDALHLYCKVKPIYFFLVAQEQKGYDKNLPTTSKTFTELIEYYSMVYKLGLHPSWQSSVAPDTAILKEEKEWLEAVIDRETAYTRQHYIKFDMPATFRRLIECGLVKDYSMGYGSINGFRASVASSYKWFDLEKNESTELLLFPFCFMDANSFYEQQYTPHQAYEEMVYYYNTIKKLNGLMVSIWHNHFLGSDKKFEGWSKIYELFMTENIYWDAYNY
jgi:hypothetical protein